MNFRSILAGLLALSLSAAPFASAMEELAPKKPGVITLNPDILRDKLVHNNLPLLIGLNKVHQATDSVYVARGNLLPRLNLGTLIGIATGGPAFSLSAVTMLLPFLVPANWANLHQSENLLAAEKLSFKLLQLNQYASAYTLYSTMLSDAALRAVVAREYQDLVGIRDWLENQRRFVGNVPQEDVDFADAQAKLAYAHVSAMDVLLARETAALRGMLSLPLEAGIQLAAHRVPSSPAESLPLAKVVAKVQAAAPENAQIQYLIQARHDVRWAKIFGFIGGANITISPGSGSPLENLAVGNNFSIGFDYVPNIALGNDQIKELELQARQLKIQQQQLVEATLNSIQATAEQVAATTEAERELLEVYQAEFRKYTLGLTDLLHVLTADHNIAQASAARVKAQLDLDLLRITLHRELLANQFASMPSCGIKPAAEKADQDWLGQLFRPGDFVLTIDDTCQPDR